MEQALISIIIPTFNKSNILRETLDSIMSQTYQNWECIIVDDGSEDETLIVLNDYKIKDCRIKIFKRPIIKPKGANACRNFGIENAKGDYLIFFDSDDIFLETCLEHRIKKIHNSNYDMVVFSMGVFKSRKKLIDPENRIVCNKSINDTIKDFLIDKKLPWSTSRPIYKSILIKNKVWFNENLQRFQDVEFNLKVLKLCQPKYISIDKIDMYYRLEDKYFTESFIKKLFPSILEFYSSVFQVLDKKEKVRFKNGLYLKLFYLIKEYDRPIVDSKTVKCIIELFKKELGLSRPKIAILQLSHILNKKYYKRKGYDRIYALLKSRVNSET